MSTPLAGEHVDARFDDLSLADAVVRRASFEGCRFAGCRLEDLQLLDCRFVDCRFEGCDLVGLKLAGSSMVETHFLGGRAMGVDWPSLRTLMLSLRFEGVRMDYAGFSGLPLQRTVFDGCSLREAAFLECDLSHASFRGSDLTGARFQHSKLVGADLRDTRGCCIHAASCTLHDTRVELSTAARLLADLGVVCTELGG